MKRLYQWLLNKAKAGVKKLYYWQFRLEYFFIGMNISMLQERQEHIAVELSDALRRESQLMVNAMQKGLV